MKDVANPLMHKGSEPNARFLRRKKRDPSAGAGQAASRGSRRSLAARKALAGYDSCYFDGNFNFHDDR
jgi:hypothetical protein